MCVTCVYVLKLENESEIEDNGAHVVESRYRDRLGGEERRELQVGKVGRINTSKQSTRICV